MNEKKFRAHYPLNDEADFYEWLYHDGRYYHNEHKENISHTRLSFCVYELSLFC